MEIERRVEAVKKCFHLTNNLDFDAYAGRGISGISMASILAYMQNKQLMIVRKPNEKSHGQPFEGFVGCNYIIVDDFIDCGATAETILNTISSFYHYDGYSKCIGFLQYHKEVRFLTKELLDQKLNELKSYREMFTDPIECVKVIRSENTQKVSESCDTAIPIFVSEEGK